jgi:hypothetical protein
MFSIVSRNPCEGRADFLVNCAVTKLWKISIHHGTRMLQLHLDKDVIIGIYVTQIVQNLAQSLCDTTHLHFSGSRYETCYSYATLLIFF